MKNVFPFCAGFDPSPQAAVFLRLGLMLAGTIFCRCIRMVQVQNNAFSRGTAIFLKYGTTDGQAVARFIGAGNYGFGFQFGWQAKRIPIAAFAATNRWAVAVALPGLCVGCLWGQEAKATIISVSAESFINFFL